MYLSTLFILVTYFFSVLSALYLVELNKSFEVVFYALTLSSLCLFSFYLISKSHKKLIFEVLNNSKLFFLYASVLIALQVGVHGFGSSGIKQIITLFSAFISYVLIGVLLFFHPLILGRYLNTVLIATVLLCFFSFL